MAPFTRGIQFCASRIGKPGEAGSFHPIGTPSKKMAYIIYGPLFFEKSNEEKVSDWSHEIFHLFNNIASPKMLVRPVSVGNIKYHHNDVKGKLTAIRNFSSEYLYRRQYEIGEAELSIPLKEGVCRKIKKQMKKLFSSSILSSAEKIEVLQNWRYELMDERSAYTAESIITKILFAPKKMSQKQLKLEVNATLKRALEPFLFDEKIAIVENVLKAEITKHRKAHAKSLKTQKS